MLPLLYIITPTREDLRHIERFCLKSLGWNMATFKERQ